MEVFAYDFKPFLAFRAVSGVGGIDDAVSLGETLLLILFVWRKHQAFTGEIFLAYIAGYGLGRLWVEALRTDSLLIPGTNFAVSQCIAGICFVTASILIVLGRKKAQRGKTRKSGG